jgi:hypothetical protein
VRADKLTVQPPECAQVCISDLARQSSEEIKVALLWIEVAKGERAVHVQADDVGELTEEMRLKLLEHAPNARERFA